MTPGLFLENLNDANTLLGGKSFVSLSQVNDSLNQTDDCRNVGPAKQYVDNAQADFAEVELVNTKTTDQDAKNSSSDTRFHGRVWVSQGLAECRRILIV